MIHGEKLKEFPLRSEINPGNLHSPLLFSTALEILAKAVRPEKESDTQKGEVKLSSSVDNRKPHIANCKDSTRKFLILRANKHLK